MSNLAPLEPLTYEYWAIFGIAASRVFRLRSGAGWYIVPDVIKIAVITDLHANLPALQAVLAAIQAEGCDRIIHTGDAIDIGPHPRECLDLLLALPKIQLLKGNHENYFVDGIPDPRPASMSDGQVAHQAWVREQLGSELRERVAAWPYVIQCEFEGVRTTFVHYALDRSRSLRSPDHAGRDFEPIVRDPAASVLDTLFGRYESQLVFYGHDHRFADR